MPGTERQPSFIVIGAVKGATTWLAHQLREHPRLWLPDAEPHYFSSEYSRGADWYRGLFTQAPADRIIGEKSADYLAHPDAAARIARDLPDVRLIAQLRNPVERAYSDYCMLYRRGLVGPDPMPYLDKRQSAQSRFLTGGLYAAHLERFLGHFPREQLCILLHDDILEAPERVIAQVCAHIAVDPHVSSPAVASRKNDSATPMLPLRMRRILRPVRPLLDPLRGNPVLARMRTALVEPVRYPPLTADLRRSLQDFYRNDVARLENLLKRDLSRWRAQDASISALTAA